MKYCIFCNYSNENYILNYVKYYVEQLHSFFDKIIFVTNQRELNVDGLSENVEVVFVENEGYDFGMWYKIIKEEKYSIKDCEQLALINDSCILFKPINELMKWITDSQSDVCGVTDSNEISYHLQSYFLYFKNKKVIEKILWYFNLNGIIRDIREVILTYEVGLSRYLVQNGYKLSAYMPIPRNKIINQSVYFAMENLQRGCPMVKKKVFCNSFRQDEIFGLKMGRYNFSKDYLSEMKKANPNMDWQWFLAD